MSAAILRVELGDRSYAIHIGAGLVDDMRMYAPYVRGRTAALVSNETVAPIYAARVEEALMKAGASRTLRIILPDGEEHKDWQNLDRIFAALLEAQADRATVIVALGGGVVGDMSGFAASAYQRGIAHIQLPTTLLSQVDSSVGGKTAINHPLGKNMIGAFHQPAVVIADTSTLATLPAREYASGLAEVVKYGAIRDLDFLAWLEREAGPLLRREPEVLAHAIHRSCELKAEIVAADEREGGVRALLNFGHTFGHAIESAAGYGNWLHGEAVSAGMALAARFSAQQGRVSIDEALRLEALLSRFGLPVKAPAYPVDTWLRYMGRDKKNEGGRVTLILLDRLGEAAVAKETSESALRAFLAAA